MQFFLLIFHDLALAHVMGVKVHVTWLDTEATTKSVLKIARKNHLSHLLHSRCNPGVNHTYGGYEVFMNDKYTINCDEIKMLLTWNLLFNITSKRVQTGILCFFDRLNPLLTLYTFQCVKILQFGSRVKFFGLIFG